MRSSVSVGDGGDTPSKEDGGAAAAADPEAAVGAESLGKLASLFDPACGASVTDEALCLWLGSLFAC